MCTILDSGVAEKLELSLCVPLHCSFAFMGPFNAMVPFALCGPFSPISRVSLSHRALSSSVRPLTGGSKVVYADSATD